MYNRTMSTKDNMKVKSTHQTDARSLGRPRNHTCVRRVAGPNVLETPQKEAMFSVERASADVIAQV